ncbi:zinc finger protein 182-like [Diabrotica virgifera virgifera]|uniref:Zinc finger protein 182-like n=1 Tax=Diabrotica virgifera virgifera TaxID=50390 RepID=A0A6P7FH03_DIAVI|nr:zinc finger protein 182-like [Diabrotica virgifera virgifera]
MAVEIQVNNHPILAIHRSICRICLNTTEPLNLWQDYENLKQLFEKITGIKIEGVKGVDRYICTKCVGQLQNIYQFIDKATYNDSLIKDTLHFCDITPFGNTQIEIHHDDRDRNDLHQSSQNNNLNGTESHIDLTEDSLEEIIQIKCENDDDINEVRSSEADDCFIEENFAINDTDSKLESADVKPYMYQFSKKTTDTNTDHTMTLRRKRTKSNKLRVPDYLRPFECPICSRRFTQKGNMHTHMRLHTGEMPFQCTFCSDRFRQLSNLNQHILTHTSNNKVCSICLRKFETDEELIQHRSTHALENKQYVCYVCSKRFSYQWSLSSHLQIHKKGTKNESNLEDTAGEDKEVVVLIP